MAEQQIDGRRRVVIEGVSPEIDCGRFAIKRVVGETVLVEADVFADGHDQVACQILYWQDMKELQSSPMKPLGDDRWRGELLNRVAAEQDVYVDLLIRAVLIEEAAGQARDDDAGLLRDWAGRLGEAKDRPKGARIALEEEPLSVLQRYPVTSPAATREKLTITVDREEARDRACRGDGLEHLKIAPAIVQVAFGFSLAGSYSPWRSQLGWLEGICQQIARTRLEKLFPATRSKTRCVIYRP